MGVKVREWKGAWWVFINHQGRRRAKRCASKKAAQLAADKIDAALRLGQVGVLDARPARVPTVAEYAEQWLKAKELKIRPSTAENYRIRLQLRILPHLGALPLTEVTRERVRAFVAELASDQNKRASIKRRPIARAYARAVLNVLHGLLAHAVDNGLIPSNSASRLSKEIGPGNHHQAQEVEVFSPAELVTVLTTAERDWPDWYPFLLCQARTGLRLGEAVALEWRDVDFPRRVLIIRRSQRKRRVSLPKNGKVRRVDMSQQLAAVLQRLQSVQEAEAVVAGVPAPERVFSTPAGEVIRDDAFRNNVWKAILRRVGIRYRKPHTLRHTFASMLIEAGEPLTYVQQQLGHHSPAFTLAVYGHPLPRGDRRAVDRLDDATFRNPRATGLEAAEQIRSHSL